MNHPQKAPIKFCFSYLFFSREEGEKDAKMGTVATWVGWGECSSFSFFLSIFSKMQI